MNIENLQFSYPCGLLSTIFPLDKIIEIQNLEDNNTYYHIDQDNIYSEYIPTF